jgi:glycosyltransferase involved in cell wall biosynthesis
MHDSSNPVARVAVLWTGLSGYLAACLRETQRQGAQLFVAHCEPACDAPYSAVEFEFIHHRFEWKKSPDPRQLRAALQAFDPHAIMVSGWHVPGYRPILREYRHKVQRIMCMDNQWRGTAKQWGGVLSSRLFIRPLCDQVWVPGERQASFASRLGFRTAQVMRGMYCCDFGPFSNQGQQRLSCTAPLPKAFLFTGRLIQEKGLDVLTSAYCRYRKLSRDPWPMLVCGEGPWRQRLVNEPGVTLLGFIQPSKLPATFALASCLVLPSRFEPWGVVVHEAAAAGLAVLASTEVGSTAHLIQDGYNGALFAPSDSRHLAKLLLAYSNSSEECRRDMAANSISLARQFTPARWASCLLSRIKSEDGNHSLPAPIFA